MICFDSFLLTSGITLTVLMSAIMISYTNKFIFVSDKLKKPTNQMFDPDHGSNFSTVCIFSKGAHSAPFERSPCFNKTLVQWYNPWVRHNLWKGFWSEIKTGNRIKQAETEVNESTTKSSIFNETVLPTDLPQIKEKIEVSKLKEKPIEFVYSILVGLLIMSGIVAFWEVCRDKFKRNNVAAAKAQERQCSLADFTINRHLRKESHQQAISQLPRQGSLEITAKVTQNLIHQSSLDRAFPKTISEAVISLETRRNSMPLHFSSDVPGISFNPVKPGKRQSVDVTREEMSLDLRKKSRHFIRRH